MLYIIISILFFTIILYLIYRNILKVLKITSIVTISSGILTFVIGYIIKNLMNSNLNFINISDVTYILMTKFVLKGIFLLSIGSIELFLYVTLNYIISTKKLSNQKIG